jgi:hypothetical protein
MEYHALTWTNWRGKRLRIRSFYLYRCRARECPVQASSAKSWVPGKPRCPSVLAVVQRPPSATTSADAGKRADGEAPQGLEALGARGRPEAAPQSEPCRLRRRTGRWAARASRDRGWGKQLRVGNGVDGSGERRQGCGETEKRRSIWTLAGSYCLAYQVCSNCPG